MEPYKIEIKEIVKDNTVQFLRYRQGIAYYTVFVRSKNQRFVFPVPLDDVGGATLEAEDRALVFMRYIKRAIREGTFLPIVR